MKATRKLIVAMGLVAMMVAQAFGMMGCHKHVFEEALSNDETSHWHAATCKHKEEETDKAEHEYGAWNEGKRHCTTCGYEVICQHTWDDGKENWKNCILKGDKVYTCTVCGQTRTENLKLTVHSYENLTCTVCGAVELGTMVKIPGTNYSMSATEVTQELYEMVMGENPSKNKGSNYPVENVSMNDAMRFCNRLSVMEGKDPAYYEDNITSPFFIGITNGNGYRLPMWYEWRDAAMGGAKLRLLV